MRRTTIILSAFLLGTRALAQPTITEADAPQIGQHLEYIIGNFAPITLAGEHVTWDLTDAGDAGTINVDFIAVDAAPGGSTFLDAEVALSAEGQVDFLRIDAQGFHVVGSYITGQDLPIHYSDDYVQLPYPCTYNTALTDPYSAVYQVQGNDVLSTGTATLLADGYGDLVLPWGTVENVLKVTVDADTHDMAGENDFHSVSHIVYFYRPGLGLFVLKATDFSLFINDQLAQNNTSLIYLTESTMDISGAFSEAIGIEVFPVPASERMNVLFNLASGRRADATLFDATGKAVRSFSMRSSASGLQQRTMEVDGLPAGVYLLRITDDLGQRGTRRVVID